MADKSTGYISLWRSFKKWEWYTNTNVKCLFIELLLSANREDKNWQGIKIKKGQLITSVARLSKETNLSIQNVRTALEKLVLTNEITIQTFPNFTIITVKNWSKYQDSNKQTNKPLTNLQQTPNKPLTTNNNQDNHNNHNKYKSAAEFEKFWKIYPKKTGKMTAQASFEKALNSGTSAKRIIDALQLIVNLKWSKFPEDEKRYIPNPTTWLNQERWNDEVDSYVQKKKQEKKVKEIPEYMKKGKKVNLDDLPF